MQFTTWGGKRVTPWMAMILDGIAAWLKANFGLGLVLRDAIRTYEEQKAIFLARYVTAGQGNGRRVYDTRWWNGQLWYRISSAGTVAQPGTSNHEVQGDNAAVDIADTGSDAGITVKNSARGRAIRAAAAQLGIEPEGDNFGEGWHFLIRGISRDPNGGGSGSGGGGGGGAQRPNPWNVIKALHWHGIAAMLRATGRYRGNNVPGPVMVSAFQRFLNEAGYARAVFGRNISQDGAFGDETAKATQQWLKAKWGYTGLIDAWFGDGTVAAWNRAENANWRAFPGSRA